MTEIELVVEAKAVLPDYTNQEFDAEQVARGDHRKFVGGVWDTHGVRQLNYMKTVGLLPEHRMLDIGCGCFRAGRFFIDYLEPDHYYGVDANQSLMQVGYDIELSDEQRARVPMSHLRANDRFQVDFDAPFDVAIAQSVFTHVSLNHIRLCLYRTAKVVKPGGSFYATFFERGRSTPVDHIISAEKRKPFYTEKNVFWYYRSDLVWAAEIGPWKANYIGDWGHPANQKMMQFIRIPDEKWAKTRAGRAGTKPSRTLVARGSSLDGTQARPAALSSPSRSFKPRARIGGRVRA